jgi:uncharacterized membrane protein YhhN
MKTFASWCAVFALAVSIGMKVWGDVDSTWGWQLMMLIGLLCFFIAHVIKD